MLTLLKMIEKIYLPLTLTDNEKLLFAGKREYGVMMHDVKTEDRKKGQARNCSIFTLHKYADFSH